MAVKRSGKECVMCGYDIFDWQEDEFDVMEGLCPECTLEAQDMGINEKTVREIFGSVSVSSPV